jgi:hypothetical protein
MSTSSTPEVPVTVLPPVPKDHPLSANQTPPPFEGMKSFYHPASGVVILGIDWLVFCTDLFTDFLALPVMCVLSFLVSFAFIYAIQKKWSKDATTSVLGKAFMGAFLVGLPFPITGTLLGAGILVLAGLPSHPIEVIKKIAERGTVR